MPLDNFETYSPISQSDEEGNLIYDSRSLENNIFKKTIQVKKKSTLLEHFVGFTSPIKNSVIRLSENQKSIDLYFLYQNSQDLSELTPDLDAELLIKGFGTLNGNIIVTPLKNNYKVTLNLDEDGVKRLNDALKSISTENNPTGLFVGSKPALEAILTYKMF